MNDWSARAQLDKTHNAWLGLAGAALLGSLWGLGCSSTITGADGSAGQANTAGNGNPSGNGGSSSGPSGGASSTAGANTTAGTNSNGNGGSGSSSGGSTGVAGGEGAPPPVQGKPSSEVCPTVQVPRTSLRRLTRFEYANSVKLMLNVDTAAVNDLPVDEVTEGFDNNAGVLTVSSLHAEKYVTVSETLAKLAVGTASLVACDTSKKTEDACAKEFAQSFGRRAFRRATTANDEQMFMTAYAAGKTGGTHAEGIEVMIRAALQSPDFLYRLETTTPTNAAAKLVPLSQFELATRLSFLIWGSGPDDGLLDSAAKGELATKEQVAARARSMMSDSKARSAVSNFYSQWIGTSRLAITSKNTTLFPTYSNDVRDAMARELPAFVEYVMWSGDHKLTTLLTSPLGFVTAPLAKIYGVTAPSGTTPQMVTFPESQGRAGILTQAGFLAVQAHPDQTSPVLRGKFVRSKLLCQTPPSPPPDVDITPPDINQGATARVRFGKHLEAGNTCSGCHTLMDPIGFSFENFDAVGTYRQKDNNQDIDASGEILSTSDTALAGAFTGVKGMATKLANSDLVRDCMATQWFRFAAGRFEAEGDTCSLSTLQEKFTASGGDLVELVVGMTQTDSFWYRSPAQ